VKPGLGDCTADPPKDGSATVFKAEARRARSKEFLIKKTPISADSVCLCGKYSFTVNPKESKKITHEEIKPWQREK
jgi:hypothetical protein